jgi:proline iminopeptidase
MTSPAFVVARSVARACGSYIRDNYPAPCASPRAIDGQERMTSRAGPATLITPTKRGDEMTAQTERPHRAAPAAPTDQPQTARRRADWSRRLRRTANQRPIRLAASFLVAASWGMATGWWMPRGPITNAEGISTMLISLAVGGVAGLATRSRWAMLLAPAAFVAAFELARLGTDGPTVDGLHVSTYGVMAFVVGRGIHGVLALLPMVLGAALGAGVARHRHPGRLVAHGSARVGLYARRGVAGLVAMSLVALGTAVARPASTDPIVGPDGKALRGSIAELTRVNVGGKDLAMMIRGHDTAKPVLLFLAGGPGGSELGAMRRHLEALEQDFVVVTWDQRGAGKSYGQLDGAPRLSPDRAVRDTVEVTEYLRERFGRDRIYLAGQSWGTILGVLSVQREPELYHAFIGTGQMVSPLETDRIIHRDTLAWAQRTGRNALVETLTDIGAPPYASILDYEPALSYEHEVYPYDHGQNSEGDGGFSENLFVEEYTLLEQVHALGAFLDSFSVLYPQIQDVDLRRSATRLAVPVHLVQGRHEARGRSELVRTWFKRLEAPAKTLTVLETSGHRPLFEQPARFRQVLLDQVLGQARGSE